MALKKSLEEGTPIFTRRPNRSVLTIRVVVPAKFITIVRSRKPIRNFSCIIFTNIRTRLTTTVRVRVVVRQLVSFGLVSRFMSAVINKDITVIGFIVKV